MNQFPGRQQNNPDRAAVTGNAAARSGEPGEPGIELLYLRGGQGRSFSGDFCDTAAQFFNTGAVICANPTDYRKIGRICQNKRGEPGVPYGRFVVVAPALMSAAVSAASRCRPCRTCVAAPRHQPTKTETRLRRVSGEKKIGGSSPPWGGLISESFKPLSCSCPQVLRAGLIASSNGCW